MRRLIVGCGYLGRRVAKRWLDGGDTVLAVTRSEEHAATLRELGIEPLIGDVTQPESLVALPECDTVLHAVGFDRSATASKREVYVDGFRNVLDQMASRCDRFLHISSTSVYGQENGELVDEDSPCEPQHESGQICLEAERLVCERTVSGELSAATILRLAGIYGPQRLLTRVEAIRQKQPLPGNPDAWLNLIHVDDAAEIVLAAARVPKTASILRTASPVSPALFLVSDDLPIQRRTYYETLARLLGVDEVRFDANAPARHTRGLGKRCTNLRLREQLNVALRYPTIVDGLPHAIAE
ncbi:NAD-dependent epimerase/dehydratase family protein [bacterium]|nr:NAD-dependent epimerase/dehydratase family protein [bacterium]